MHHWPGIFRSALFLASMMVVLDHFYWLEWLNVAIFQVLSSIAQPQGESDQTRPVRALVFTIQEELFETEFKSRSPIDRAALKKYLEEIVQIYHNVKVLAIDYDLSPNNYNLSFYREKDKCVFTNPAERDGQKALDEFLVALHKNRKIQVVLIEHIPVKTPALCECKLRWQQEKYNQGIMFGRSDILHYGLLGPVMKYAKSKNSFPEVVSAAEKGHESPLVQTVCANAPTSLHQRGDKTFKYFNFFSNGAVKVYGLDSLKDLQTYKVDLGGQAEKVNIIFFGGNYGRDDIYSTPRGGQAGVTLHAYAYYSLNDPVSDDHLRAWGFDIILGGFFGLIFHIIWRLFHECRREDALAAQVGLAALNFLILGGILVVLVYGFAQLLRLGLWLSPGPMLIGLFIDSYVASVTSYEASTLAIREGDSHDAPSVLTEGIWLRLGLVSTALFIERSIPSIIATGKRGAHGHTSPLRQLFGVPNDGIEKWWDLLVHVVLKIAVFWMIIGMAMYILITDH